MTRLTSRLPEGEANGLDLIAAELIGLPGSKHVGIVIFDCDSVITKYIADPEAPTSVPVARIRRIEIIRSREDLDLCEQMMRRSWQARHKPEEEDPELPLDLQEPDDDLGVMFKEISVDPFLPTVFVVCDECGNAYPEGAESDHFCADHQEDG